MPARPGPPPPTATEQPRQGDKMKELHAFSASICAATHGRFTPQIGGLPITERRHGDRRDGRHAAAPASRTRTSSGRALAAVPQVRDVDALDDRHRPLELDRSGFSASKNGVPSPSRTGTRSIQTSSSRPASRHWRAIVPPLTPTTLSPASDLACSIAPSMPR